MFHRRQLTIEFSRRLAYYVKAAPKVNYKRSCSNSASFVAGGPFRKDPPHDMKCTMCLLRFLGLLNILNSEILQFGGERDHSFNLKR